jgi:1-acyl-sn-glycerol-3-phosphate acyltransferase
MKEKYNDNKYRFGRNISTFVMRSTLNPKMIGKYKLPIEGPVIFCGNHLHVWDQFPVMCATKIPIHWMAKKEYFDGKLGPIFKFMGCISVDRKGNPQKSKDEALAYLKDGSSIGLFPEGTRNGLKEERVAEVYSKYPISSMYEYEYFKEQLLATNPRLSQLNFLNQLYETGRITKDDYLSSLLTINDFLIDLTKQGIITIEEYDDSLLLPFKFGAASMAKETGVPIVPFAVTGDYKIGNDNLTVQFGDIIDPTDLTVEETNIKLRHKVLELVKDNYKK